MTCYLSNDCITWYLIVYRFGKYSNLQESTQVILYNDRDGCVGGVIVRV